MAGADPSGLRVLAAEAVGTMLLVLFGCGAIMLDETALLPLGVGGVAVVFGITVAAMVAWLGPVSGAHINPAVTFAMWTRGRLKGHQAVRYVAAQVVGAAAAALVLRAWLADSTLGATRIAATLPVWTGWLLEAAATALLVFVILVVATGPPLPGALPPLAIGSVVGLAAFVIGPLTGASLNPARSFGPAIVSLQLDGLFLFLVAPIAGGAVGAWLACRFMPDGRCCAEPAAGAEGAT